jgi:catechol 2,3-dioxygenase-like lactoylglutathione lyase family enzyme
MVTTYTALAAGILVVTPITLGSMGDVAPTPDTGLQLRPTLTLQVLVSDLNRSIAFYARTLGFTVTERRDDLKFAHLSTNVPGLELGLNEVAESPIRTSGMVLNFGVKDVAEGRRALESRGVTFLGPTHVIPGKVALAEFKDPDGHRLRIAGPPPPSGDEAKASYHLGFRD